MLVIDRQIVVNVDHSQDEYSFSHAGQVHYFREFEKINEFFQNNTSFSTVKFICDGSKHYIHFFQNEMQYHFTEWSLRTNLFKESGGSWIEERAGKSRFFVEIKGPHCPSFKEIKIASSTES